MLDLRGTCRPGDFGESGDDKDGTASKLEKQEKLKGTNEMRRQSIVSPLISQAQVKVSTMWPHLLVSTWKLQVYAKEKGG